MGAQDEVCDSLKSWLDNLLDAEGRPIEVPEHRREEALRVINSKDDPWIYLYTMQYALEDGARFMDHSQNRGSNYSLYYLALNNTLNHDTRDSLIRAMKLIRHMEHGLLYDDNKEKRMHQGGCTVYKGDTAAPPMEAMRKLQAAQDTRTLIRFRQFQSTTANEEMARKFQHRRGPADEGGSRSGGYLWIIDLPSRMEGGGFWGARDIQSASKSKHELETLFPPYSPFRVKYVDDQRCHLEAVDRCEDTAWVEFRHRISDACTQSIVRLAIVPPPPNDGAEPHASA